MVVVNDAVVYKLVLFEVWSPLFPSATPDRLDRAAI